MLPEIEQELARKLKWSTVNSVPGFPASDFHELKHLSESGELVIGVDRTAADNLAHVIFNRWYSFTIGLLQSIPFLMAIATVLMAFVLRSFWVLIGIPLSLFAMLLANPLNPVRGFATLIGLAAIFGAMWFSTQSIFVLAFITVSYGIPFWGVRFVYYWNTQVLRLEALESETLFLFLLQNRIISVPAIPVLV